MHIYFLLTLNFKFHLNARNIRINLGRIVTDPEGTSTNASALPHPIVIHESNLLRCQVAPEYDLCVHQNPSTLSEKNAR